MHCPSTSLSCFSSRHAGAQQPLLSYQLVSSLSCTRCHRHHLLFMHRRRRLTCCAAIRHDFERYGATAMFALPQSGLLWARTTGLKLWPGAVVLSDFILRYSEHIDNNKMQAILAPPLEGSSSADAAQSTSGRVAINGEAWKDRSVLELGCGVGMLSVVAAWMGARVRQSCLAFLPLVACISYDIERTA